MADDHGASRALTSHYLLLVASSLSCRNRSDSCPRRGRKRLPPVEQQAKAAENSAQVARTLPQKGMVHKRCTKGRSIEIIY
jgi:hypothetical protein